MPSVRKSESARINGAKSRGPKTDAGRHRSSQNSLKHGLTAQAVVLPIEDPEEFNQFRGSYLAQFNPNGPAELHLVDEMVAAKWRLQRLAIVETELYTEALDHIEENSDEPLNPSQALSGAFNWLASSTSYNFLQRIESRLERTYSRALRTLIQLQREPSRPPGSAPKPDKNKIRTNEPTDPVQTNSYFALDAGAQPQQSPPTPVAPPSVPAAALNSFANPTQPPATIHVYVPRLRAHRHRLARSQKVGRLVRPAPRLPHQPYLRRQLLRARG